MRSTFRLIRPALLAEQLSGLIPQVRAAPLALTPDSAELIRARLHCGDFEDVRTLLIRASPNAALPLALARYHAWSGDLHTTLAVFPTVHASLPLLHGEPRLRATSWRELHRTATDIGDPMLAAELVRLARGEPTEPLPHKSDAAAHLNRVLDELLDAEPDAHRGRIRLRPRLGSADAIHIHDLRFGDGTLSLHAERGPHGVEYRITQDSGATPFTVVLEPVVPQVAGMAVDGAPARLEIRPHDGGFIVPVQLVLDDVRCLLLRDS